jgi:hypothetical protein
MRAAQQAARDAERRFAMRIRIAVPHAGFGDRLNQMQAWLDQNAGADGWALTPSGIRGVVNDAIALYFADVTIASANCHDDPAGRVHRLWRWTPRRRTRLNLSLDVRANRSGRNPARAAMSIAL